MSTSERFSRADIQRILKVSAKQLAYWERLEFVPPRKGSPDKSYDFRDLISLRTAKQLIEKGIPANRLQRSLAALRKQLSEVNSPLNELRILSNGRQVVVEQNGSRVEPITGQLVLNFETRELSSVVQVRPRTGAEDLFAAALRLDSPGTPQVAAIEAYERVLEADPDHVHAWMNLGTLHYEQGSLAEAAECFRRAAASEPTNALAHYNLGSVLEALGELGEARTHLRRAIALNERSADAHYNLAFVCEKLGEITEARQHWQRYLDLDPKSPWAKEARQHLAAVTPFRPNRKS
ncbi:MAG TPA: tetratricopeptide repeat protein [Candidatus Acidoferrales bacterium]|jgi:tetratricopeptide (TPR) repeat protein|nr:tetratricopeptide repeat protein [Candidatus Acidoferrales bacterium]